MERPRELVGWATHISPSRYSEAIHWKAQNDIL